MSYQSSIQVWQLLYSWLKISNKKAKRTSTFNENQQASPTHTPSTSISRFGKSRNSYSRGVKFDHLLLNVYEIPLKRFMKTRPNLRDRQALFRKSLGDYVYKFMFISFVSSTKISFEKISVVLFIIPFITTKINIIAKNMWNT